MCFFKQRTAYEMRISDWRSDVCSSDLCIGLFDGKIVDLERETRGGFAVGRAVIDAFGGPGRMEVEFQNENLVAREDGRIRALVPDLITIMDRRSEEHTSELQSLMRRSYAVLCLKKKKENTIIRKT